MTHNEALVTAVDSEFAAIFTYGLTTAFIGSDHRDTVGEFIAEHRVRCDALNAALVSAGEPEQVPAAGYTLPFEVTDDTTSVTALLQAETTCASAYRALVENAESPEIRRLGVDGLTECASRIAYWRGVSGQSPTTVPFPGAG